MRTSKRLTAVFLLILMVLTVLPVSPVFAADAGASFQSSSAVVPAASISAELPSELPDIELPEDYHFSRFHYVDENGETIYFIETDPSEYGLADGYWINAGGERVADPVISVTNTKRVSGAKRSSKAPLPSSYDSRALGYITPVENQIGGTCWAHAAVATMEANAIKKGYATNTTIDLSEYFFAWHGYNSYYKGVTDSRNDGHIDTDTDTDHVLKGGNFMIIAGCVLNFCGPANESDYAFTSVPEWDLYEEMQAKFTFEDRLARDYAVTAVIPVEADVEAIKQAVYDYGACDISYNSNDAYYPEELDSVDTPYAYYNPLPETVNHSVTVVGWDDDFSVDNFTVPGAKPENNGAFLIKNSWGDSFANDGYFWISYEDATISSCVVFEVEKVDDSKNAYFYDGLGDQLTPECEMAANVFTAGGDEILCSVSRCYPIMKDTSYSFKIYRLDPDFNDPTDGELLYAQTGNGNGGKYVDLDEPVLISAGETFSVVFDDIFVIPMENYVNSEYGYYNSNPRESYYYRDGVWFDACVAGEGNVCIRAITKDQKKESRVTYTDAGAFHLRKTAVDGRVELPAAREGYTWVCEYNGEPFTGTGVTENITVTAHCYPTEGEKKTCGTYYNCIYCGKEMLPPEVDHKGIVEFPAEPATCISIGLTAGSYCEVCGETIVYQTLLEMTDHSYVAVRVPASASSIGYTVKTCSFCGATAYSDFEYAPADHTFGNGPELTLKISGENCAVFAPDFFDGYSDWGEAAALAEGVKNVYLMNVVGALGKNAFSGLPNTETVSLPASLFSVDTLSFAGLSSLEAIMADGENEFFTSIDGVLFDKNVTTLIAYPANRAGEYYKVPASVTAIGLHAFDGCVNLRYLDLGDTAIEEIDEETQNTLSVFEYVNLPSSLAQAHTHEYSNVIYTVQAEGCNAPGLTLTACACGQFTAQTDVIPHTKGEARGSSAATCGEDGYTLYVCTVCGEEYRDEIIPATGGHTWEWVIDRYAICIENGVKHQTCTVCGAVQNKNTAIVDPDAHYWLWEVDDDPTCGDDGAQHQFCLYCDATRNEDTVIPAYGIHDWQWVVVTPSTCAVRGVQQQECTSCGAVQNENTPLPLDPEHSWAWYTDVEATRTVPGVKHRECTICHTMRDRDVPYYAGHSFTAEIISDEALQTAGDCCSPAIYYYSCAKCGKAEMKDDHTFISDVFGDHVWDEGTDIAPATCTSEGQMTYTCTVCGEERTETIDMAAHVDADGDGYCDICETDLAPDGRCKLCGKIHNGILGRIVSVIHRIVFYFQHLFGR